MGKVVEMGQVYDTVLFEADVPDLFSVCYDREALVGMIPSISKKAGVVKVWMDGDKLMARVRNTVKLQQQRAQAARRR